MTNESEAGPSFVIMVHHNDVKDLTEYRLSMTHGDLDFEFKMKYSITTEALVKMPNAFLATEIISYFVEGITEKAPWYNPNWIQNKLMKFDTLNNKPMLSNPCQAIPASSFASGGTVKSAGEFSADWVDAKPVDVQLNELSDLLPGMQTEVEYPCECLGHFFKSEDGEYIPAKKLQPDPLKAVIMHMNDAHSKDWSDDRICEWLDDLHDNGVVDLSIEIPDKEIQV